MKITRKQLRQLINESMTRPNIPNIPSDDFIGKIDSLARSDDNRLQADSFAGTFGYPEDRSYSDDLHAYDEIGRIGPDIHKMSELGYEYADADSHDDGFGGGEGQYFRRSAMKKASEICNSHDMSVAKVLIDAFTAAANDYEKAAMARIGSTPNFEYEGFDIAGRIQMNGPHHSGKMYSDLY